MINIDATRHWQGLKTPALQNRVRQSLLGRYLFTYALGPDFFYFDLAQYKSPTGQEQEPGFIAFLNIVEGNRKK